MIPRSKFEAQIQNKYNHRETLFSNPSKKNMPIQIGSYNDLRQSGQNEFDYEKYLPMKKTIQKRNTKKLVQTTSSTNPYQQFIKQREEVMSLSSGQNNGGAVNASSSTKPGTSTRREVPRMVKSRAGVSFKDITVKAIMGEEDMHLPTYLNKIRPTQQIS